MNAHRLSIRWSRFGRDLVVIILGVLVAIAFDNFKSNRADRRLERQYLHRLARDLRQDSTMLVDYLKIARRGEQASAALLIYLKSGGTAADSSIARKLSDATRGAYLTPNNAAFLELTTTGNLRLLRDDELRNGLFNYYTSVQRYQRSLETVMKRGKDPLGELGWEVHAYDDILGYAVNLGSAPARAADDLPTIEPDPVPLLARVRRQPNATVAVRRALTYNGMLQPIVGEWIQSLELVRNKLPE